jgi:hypothetical protein
VLANVPAAIADLRALLARMRGGVALAAGYDRQALAHLGEDDWLMRSFVRWNLAVDWLGGRLGPAERGLAEVLAELRAAGEAFTAKKHVTHLLGKLGADNRTETAARARHLGLIPDTAPLPAR